MTDVLKNVMGLQFKKFSDTSMLVKVFKAQVDEFQLLDADFLQNKIDGAQKTNDSSETTNINTLPFVDFDSFELALLPYLASDGSFLNSDAVKNVVSTLGDKAKSREHKSLIISILEKTKRTLLLTTFSISGGVKILSQWIQRAISEKDLALTRRLVNFLRFLPTDIISRTPEDNIKLLQQCITKTSSVCTNVMENQSGAWKQALTSYGLDTSSCVSVLLKEVKALEDIISGFISKTKTMKPLSSFSSSSSSPSKDHISSSDKKKEIKKRPLTVTTAISSSSSVSVVVPLHKQDTPVTKKQRLDPSASTSTTIPLGSSSSTSTSTSSVLDRVLNRVTTATTTTTPTAIPVEKDYTGVHEDDNDNDNYDEDGTGNGTGNGNGDGRGRRGVHDNEFLSFSASTSNSLGHRAVAVGRGQTRIQWADEVKPYGSMKLVNVREFYVDRDIDNEEDNNNNVTATTPPSTAEDDGDL
eukprot:gene2788-5495_t